MTIIASVKVRDGLILGTDSMTQISAATPQGPQIVKWYSNARKLFQIKERAVGAMTYGLGNIGNRSIEGLVLDFCASQGATAPTIQELSQELYDFIKPRYEGEYAQVAVDQRPVLGFFLAGYSDNQPFPEEYEFLLPRDAGPSAARNPDEFGASWRGIGNPFTRLYKGVDPEIAPRLKAKGLTDQDVNDVFQGLETHVVYDGMPVQDAIDFASYILNTTIGWTTFAIGVPGCGGPLQVATILADVGFAWVERPQHRMRSSLVR